MQRINMTSSAEHTLCSPLQTLTLPVDKIWETDGQIDQLWRAQTGKMYLPEFLSNHVVLFSGAQWSRQPGKRTFAFSGLFLDVLPCLLSPMMPMVW